MTRISANSIFLEYQELGRQCDPTVIRVNTLANVKVPSLVVHGASDPLIPIDAGIDTAACIPDCTFVRVEGMDHNIPVGLVPELSALLLSHFNRSIS